MANQLYPNLNPNKALIFRITHRDNLPWLLRYGLHCSNSTIRDPSFISIGNPELIAWDLLQRRDFQRDPEDPRKLERYQAEALVHHRLPASALLGVSCYTEDVRSEVDAEAVSCGLELHIVVRPAWYF
jgi:hypothetical protein